MATTTIGTRQFMDSAFTHALGLVRMHQNQLTLEQDNSSGVLTLALNGVAVSAVAPHANPALVTLTAGGQSANMPAADFLQLCTFPAGAASGQVAPPSRPLGQAWEGWALARLVQLGVSIDTALRIGARFIG